MNDIQMKYGDMQLVDGKWVEAKPEPFYRDRRPVWVRVIHTLMFWRDEDKVMEKWWTEEE